MKKENTKKETQEMAERINEEIRAWRSEEARKIFANRGVRNEVKEV